MKITAHKINEQAPDKRNKIGIMFMDLSKAFDTLNNNSLPVKLNAHGFFFNTVNDLTKYN